MKLPKKLSEQRDELEKRKWINKVLNSTGERLAFHEGFDVACEILIPQLEKMKEALTFYSGRDYEVRVTKAEELFNGILTIDKGEISKQALQSYREVMGDE